jgi:hypothetical protein
MTQWTADGRWRAAAAATFLLLAGGVMGVLADRHWLSPPPVEASPLTADAMTTRLGLSSAEAARIRALLDSLHADIHTAVGHGPDSLQGAIRNAQWRIENALPLEARSEFRAWMREQYQHTMEHMRDRMHDGRMDHRPGHGRDPREAHTDNHRLP